MWAPCGHGNVCVECFAENQKWNKWFSIGIKGDKLEVEVEVLAKVLLKKETWSKRNRAVQVVESRTEYPLSFFFLYSPQLPFRRAKRLLAFLLYRILHCVR